MYGPIVVEARALSAEVGGVARYVRGLVKGLMSVAPDLPLVLIADHPRGQRAFPGHRSCCVNLPHPALRRLWDRYLFPRAVRRLRPSLVHATKPGSGAGARGLPPIVATIYDVLPLTQPETQNLAQRLYWQRALPDAAHNSAHLLTISEASRQAIVERLGVPIEKVSVTYPGLDESFVAPAEMACANLRRRLSLADPFVLTFGRQDVRRDLALVIRAFRRLAADFPHQLVVFGAGAADNPKVRRALRETNLGRRVRFLGHVPENDLPALYAAAEVFVFASRGEGFGFPALEAMASGVPVLVSSVGSLPEVVADSGLLVPLRVEAFASALASLLCTPRRRAELIARGQARARTFSWEGTARETLRVYARVLSGGTDQL